MIGSGDIWELNIIGFVCAVVAAVAVLSVAESAGLGQGKKKNQLDAPR